MSKVFIRGLAVVVVSIALLATSCGDNGAGGGSAGGGGAVGSATTTLQPQTGGTLKFAAYSEIFGLDPLVALGHGTSGGIQMAAVYDTLMRYNTDTHSYENNMTESVVPNADSTVWTIKLKPGIKFSDGTDFDADAVRFGLNRYRSGQPGAPPCAELIACPNNPRSSNIYMSLVSDIKTVDSLTLSVTLSQPWASFPYALSQDSGLIPSPTAIKKCDGTKPPRDCAFNLSPVGAGPFMVESFKPNDSINLVRNPNYFGGPVHLDRLTFVTMADGGGDKTYEALKSGGVQGAYLRTPQAVAAAHDAKFQGLSTVEQAAELLYLNMGVSVNCVAGKPEPRCVGKPDGATPTNPVTKNLKLRQALAAAWNPQVLNDRVFNDKGLVSTSLFQKSFTWDPGVPGPKYDPDLAKKLVTELKAEGWDGKLRLLYNDTMTEEGLAAVTMFRAVGMDPELLTPPSTAQQTTLFTNKDFDVAVGGTSTGDDDSAVWSLAQALDSRSASNRVGFSSPKVDQALRDLRAAKTDDQRKVAYKVIAEEVNAQLPWITKVAKETFNAFSPKVHGVTLGMRVYLYFDKAWIEK